jgi:Raf kinase inhibitor-like YbhB/YbcL family protein
MEEIKVTSSAFGEGEMIPAEYTADGRNISPPLEWSPAPAGTKSIALINDDPDAPMGAWVHWILYNIPPDVTSLEENVPPDETLANGAQQGTTDFGRIGYGGPAPPSGTHRYYFKVYALDMKLDPPARASKGQLESEMAGHVLAYGQLLGLYARK